MEKTRPKKKYVWEVGQISHSQVCYRFRLFILLCLLPFVYCFEDLGKEERSRWRDRPTCQYLAHAHVSSRPPCKVLFSDMAGRACMHAPAT